MIRKLSSAVVALGLVTTTACYHAVVETGRTAGTTVVQKPWTSTFIFGLVEAKEINVARECPNGVARVETQMSFVNGLATAITFGLYTPRTVTITCAANRTGALPESSLPVVVARDASAAAGAAAVTEASELSARTHQAVLVRF
jgi:hypothetical protein